MLKTGLKTLLLAAVASVALSGAASAGKLTIESWRNDDADDLAGQDHPGLRGQAPGHQGRVRARPRRRNTMPR